MHFNLLRKKNITEMMFLRFLRVNLKSHPVITLGIVLSLCFGCFFNGVLAEQEVEENNKTRVAIINTNFQGIGQINLKSKVVDAKDFSKESSEYIDMPLPGSYNNQEVALQSVHGTLVTKKWQEAAEKSGVKLDDAELLLYKTVSEEERSVDDFGENVIKAIRTAREKGADVINISMGDDAGHRLSPDMKNKVDNELRLAKNDGIVIVAASGNDGDSKKYGEEGKQMGFPARSDHTIAVGSHDNTGTFQTYTSGVGDDHLDFSTEEDAGTSFSSPVVAAFVTKLKQAGIEEKYDLNKDGEWDKDEIRAKMEDVARNGESDLFKSVKDVRSKELKSDGYEKRGVAQEDKFTSALYYKKDDPKIFIEEDYLNTGRYDEFIGALEKWEASNSGDGEYCYVSHAYQACGFETQESCEISPLPQDAGSCGKVGDVVDTQDGQKQIAAISPAASNTNTGNSNTPSSGNTPGTNTGTNTNGNSPSGTNTTNNTNTSTVGLVHCGLTSNYEDRCTLCDLIVGIKAIIVWGRDILVVVAMVAIVAGGIMYIVSAGDNGMMESAKNVIKQALWGVVIVLGAWVIVNTAMWLLATKLDNVGVGNWFEFNCESGIAAEGDDDTKTGGDGTVLDGATTCTEFIYSGWTVCQPDGTQTRSVTSQRPSGCSGGTPGPLSQPCTYTGGLPAAPASETEARNNLATLSGGNISVWESSDGATNIRDLRQTSVDGVVNFQKEVGVPITVTGAAESGGPHQDGTYSHANGYKVDIDDSPAVDSYITTNYDRIPGIRNDGAIGYVDSNGNTYYRETNPSHWDVTYK